jgi:hypothetical protein
MTSFRVGTRCSLGTLVNIEKSRWSSGICGTSDCRKMVLRSGSIPALRLSSSTSRIFCSISFRS